MAEVDEDEGNGTNVPSLPDISTAFEEYENQDHEINGQSPNPVNHPYAYLKASFSEMTSIMKGNITYEELKEVKEYMDNVTNKSSKS